ncbi:MAG: IPTL-CTERM sorting domain-containing protein, partial [Chitinophagales bacterium]
STQDGNTSTDNRFPQIDGSIVVWRGNDGTTRQIYLYDGSNVTKVSTQDGNTSTNNQFPQIDGSNVVWYGNDGTTNQIYLAENCATATTTNLEVPTLSEWGLIILALLLMTAGTLYLVQQPRFEQER